MKMGDLSTVRIMKLQREKIQILEEMVEYYQRSAGQMARLLNMRPPQRLECPVCFAKAGEPCTQATEKGRRKVKWFHFKREELAYDREVLS